MDFTQSMDNGYMIPTSVAVGSGEATDIRCVCDTVEDFKAFLDATGMELRYEGLVTYEKVNKRLMVYEGNNNWKVIGEGGSDVDTSNFITLAQLSQQLNSYYTKAQTDNKISEEITKAQIGGSGEVDLSAYATKNYVDDEISKIELKEGPQGPKGDKGERGEQGPAGIIDTITIDMISGIEFTDNIGTPTINVSSISVDKNITVSIFNKATINANISPSNATNKQVNWSSNNSNISIIPNGLKCEIEGKSYGESIVTVTTVDGSYTASCRVTVEEGIVSVQSISLDKNSSNLKVGESEQLNVSFVPSNATNKNITWTSSHVDVITVENGLVKAISKGNGTITATSQDGNKIAICDYTIINDEVEDNPVQQSCNIFDKNTMLGTGKVVINGSIISSPNFNYCLIPVRQNSQYAIQKADSWLDTNYKPAVVGQLGYLSSEDTIISGEDMSLLTKTTDGKGITFTTPAGCNYIMLSLGKQDLGDALQIESGDTIHNYYQPYGGAK